MDKIINPIIGIKENKEEKCVECAECVEEGVQTSDVDTDIKTAKGTTQG